MIASNSDINDPVDPISHLGMKRVLCYGDSNTWGYVPAGLGSRFAPAIRWTGILQVKLGDTVCIVEEGLNGRTTAWEDPSHPGRNGAQALPGVLREHSPLDLIVIMLGANDMKHELGLTASNIALGLKTLLMIVRCSQTGPLSLAPEVLLVSPPGIRLIPFSSFPEFRGALQKSRELPALYAALAKRHCCHFLNATELAAASIVDGVHLDEEGHRKLGEAMALKLASLLKISSSNTGNDEKG